MLVVFRLSSKVQRTILHSCIRHQQAYSYSTQSTIKKMGKDPAQSGTRTSINLSLDRIGALLNRLGKPQDKFPVIHVAGTNAKGSTIFYLDRILRNVVGLRTATFTSPHLLDERDACTINGQTIDQATWQQASESVRAATLASLSEQDDGEQYGQCTPFEQLTAQVFVAFDLLKDPFRRPEVLLVEVGMGGALDATNVFTKEQVLASVITSVDFDHQAMLGDTLKAIATQKAGIVKPGGLCILADQRRSEMQRQKQDVDCTRASAAAMADGDEVEQAVCRASIEQQARLVKQYTPWHALEQNIVPVSGTSSWASVVRSHVHFSPTLSQSKLRQEDYVAATGDNVVAGPTLNALPATRAALMGAHVALQTLFSIARDESPYARGSTGDDAYEELRLHLAFALRDDRFARATLESALMQAGQEQFAGRAEWLQIALPPTQSQPLNGPTEIKQDEETMDVEQSTADEAGVSSGEEKVDVEDVQQSPQMLSVLLDGAHNTSAASALRRYVDTCIASRAEVVSEAITVTWILAFSQGKKVDEMIAAFLGSDGNTKDKTLTEKVEAISLHAASSSATGKQVVHHRFACVPFSTPVQGMPWVQCVAPKDVEMQLTSSLQFDRANVQVKTFDDSDAQSAITNALRWASTFGNGTPTVAPTAAQTDNQEQQSSSMIIVAGSLYLVSDIHRLFVK